MYGGVAKVDENTFALLSSISESECTTKLCEEGSSGLALIFSLISFIYIFNLRSSEEAKSPKNF